MSARLNPTSVTGPSVNDIQTSLEKNIATLTDSEVQIGGLARLAGGASQEMWRLDLKVGEGPQKGAYQLVMRRQLGGKIHTDALSLADEFRVLQAAASSKVPVPHPYWFLPDVFGVPAYLMQRLEGETIGRRIVKEPNLAEARAKLPLHMGAALSAIHRIDADAHDLCDILPAPAEGYTPAQHHITQMEADLDRLGEPHPAIELCLRWLRLNEPPAPEKLVLLHGDYRIGNMVVTSQGLVGVLDWEFAHLGDPAEDLAWSMVRDWRFGVDNLRFGGIAQPLGYLVAYAERSGIQITPDAIDYWEIMGNLRWAIGSLNQANRHLSGEEFNLEFASLGRRCAEMELEALTLVMEKRR